jgi:hypothetical protein
MANDWAEGMKRARQFAFPENGPFVGPGQPEPDALVEVGWDQNKLMPAYRVNGELVPFTPLVQSAPEGSKDWYVEAFADAAIKARWREADAVTRARIDAKSTHIEIPHQFRATGSLDARGRIDPHGEVDLRAVRRPAFFGQAPWSESIAEVEARTSVVEIEVPREPYETMHMGLSDPIRLRGWHIAGDGLPGGMGRRTRAMIVLTGGRSIETTAIHHPDDPACLWSDEADGWLQTSYPDKAARTEAFGARPWRTYLHAFALAGFDVLTLDKRGHGISGGASDSNTSEQGEDIFRALDALETGKGARILLPNGSLSEGATAAGKLLAGHAAKSLPIFVSGASQGCMVSCWAMHKNFIGACDFDRPLPRSHGPLGYNIVGALLLAPFGGGLGYRTPDDALIEAHRRLDRNVQMFPSGDVLGGVSRWPALFVGRGLWDFSESLEGSLACLKRCKGPRMIATVRAPHGEGEWGAGNIGFMQEQMVAFATHALRGEAVPGYVEPYDVRDAVAAAPAAWAPAARPERSKASA